MNAREGQRGSQSRLPYPGDPLPQVFSGPRRVQNFCSSNAYQAAGPIMRCQAGHVFRAAGILVTKHEARKSIPKHSSKVAMNDIVTVNPTARARPRQDHRGDGSIHA